MGFHVTFPWLIITAAFGKSDLGPLGIAAAILGLLALAVAVGAAIRKPSWPLLWLVLPLAVTHLFLQIVDIMLIGDHHETAALSLYGAALLLALVAAAYAARANRLAVAGAVIFALVYAWFAFEVSLFVFWNGFH